MQLIVWLFENKSKILNVIFEQLFTRIFWIFFIKGDKQIISIKLFVKSKKERSKYTIFYEFGPFRNSIIAFSLILMLLDKFKCSNWVILLDKQSSKSEISDNRVSSSIRTFKFFVKELLMNVMKPSSVIKCTLDKFKWCKLANLEFCTIP